MPRRPLLVFALLLLAPHLASCLPVLEVCTVDGDPFTVWEDGAFCEAPCFVDADRDGHGATPSDSELWVENGCVGEGLTTRGGDCDDRDPRRFLGAIEVCDGVDNDCMSPEFVPDDGGDEDPVPTGEEQVDDGPPGTWACSPPDGAPVQLFVLAGSVVGGANVDPRGIVQVEANRAIDGVLRIGAVIPQAAPPAGSGPIALGAVASWLPDRVAGFQELNSNLRGEPQGDQPFYVEYEVSLDEIEGPGELAESQVLHLILAAAVAPNAAAEASPASWAASLTDPWYCYEEPPIGPGAEPCPPVWSEDMPADTFDDLDLADMDSLDLAACVGAGQARLPVITQAFDDDEEPCTIRPAGRDCFPLYETRAMGCAYLQIVVKPDDEDDQ